MRSKKCKVISGDCLLELYVSYKTDVSALCLVARTHFKMVQSERNSHSKNRGGKN